MLPRVRPPTAGAQKTDSTDTALLLRPGGERRGEKTAGQGSDKRPAVHYSIT